MRNRHQRTLGAIFAHPLPGGLRWSEVEALLVALGPEVEEHEGSRVAVLLNGVAAVFHRPRPEMDKGAVRSVKRFLSDAGVEP